MVIQVSHQSYFDKQFRDKMRQPMNRAYKLAIVIFFTFFNSSAFSAGEMDEWYTAKNGMTLVQEMVYGNLYALLGKSNGEQIRVYIISMNDPDCPKIGMGVIAHNPIYVNDKLVRFSQYCNNENTHFFYPTTDEGNAHIIKQFMKSELVEMRMYDSNIKYLFSAKNFNTALSNMSIEDKGI